MSEVPVYVIKWDGRVERVAPEAAALLVEGEPDE